MLCRTSRRAAQDLVALPEHPTEGSTGPCPTLTLFRDRISEVRCRNTSQGSLCATLPCSSPTSPAVLPCPHCCGAPGPTPVCKGAPPPCLQSPLTLLRFTPDLLLWAEPLARPLLHQPRAQRDRRGDHSCSPSVQSYLIFSFPVKQLRLHTVSCDSHRSNYQQKSHFTHPPLLQNAVAFPSAGTGAAA